MVAIPRGQSKTVVNYQPQKTLLSNPKSLLYSKTCSKQVLPLRFFLTYIWPMFPFYTPCKYTKAFENLWFSCVLRGIKWEHWPDMGQFEKDRSALLQVYISF